MFSVCQHINAACLLNLFNSSNQYKGKMLYSHADETNLFTEMKTLYIFV